uniref:Uncharacterized protein n=1 Tax=Cairina moschata TaxID=8855 RepID=A0A8C3BMB5_CAIMO
MSWLLACDRPEREQLKALLLAVLNFTALLIEYSFSRHLYSSIEHLTTLLASSDMQVVLAVLNLLYVFSKRSNYITRLGSDKRTPLLSRLQHLAESWGGKENGFGLAECCRDLHMMVSGASPSPRWCPQGPVGVPSHGPDPILLPLFPLLLVLSSLDPAFSDGIRHVMDGSLPTSLKHIISNAEYYGPSLFLLATEVVTVFVFQEPSLLSSLQDNGLTDVMLHALLIKDVPATREVLGSLPNVFSALCLNARGLQSFVQCQPFERLFKVLLSPDYLPAMRRRRSSDPLGESGGGPRGPERGWGWWGGGAGVRRRVLGGEFGARGARGSFLGCPQRSGKLSGVSLFLPGGQGRLFGVSLECGEAFWGVLGAQGSFWGSPWSSGRHFGVSPRLGEDFGVSPEVRGGFLGCSWSSGEFLGFSLELGEAFWGLPGAQGRLFGVSLFLPGG